MIPAWLLALIESITYAAARGWERARLDIARDGIIAVEEKPDAADLDRVAAARDAAARGMLADDPSRADPARSGGGASSVQAGNGPSLGPSP